MLGLRGRFNFILKEFSDQFISQFLECRLLLRGLIECGMITRKLVLSESIDNSGPVVPLNFID